MARSVVYESKLAVRQTEKGHNFLYQINIRPFVVGRNIIYSALPCPDYKINGRAMVGDVKPIANVTTVAVEGDRAAVNKSVHRLWNKLLAMLESAVIVGRAADGNLKTVGPGIREGQEVCRRLADAVGRGGLNGRLLVKASHRVQLKITVYLVGGYLVKTADTVAKAGVKKHLYAENVRFKKGRGVGY